MAQGVESSLGVVILAAGASSRMGKSKMLLPWGESTVLGHLIGVWRELRAAQIAVVCAADDEAVKNELFRLGFSTRHQIVNHDPSRGMFSSIQCAAAWNGWDAGLTHWVIVLGDQPHLQLATLRALINFAACEPCKVCQPGWRGRPRHPVLLPKHVFAKITRSKAETLRDFLLSMASDVRLIETGDPGLGLDIDNAADFENTRRLYFDK